MSNPTSWLWLHVSGSGFIQESAIREMDRPKAEESGKARLQDDWLLSVPLPKRNTFLPYAEAEAMADRFRAKHLEAIA